MFKWYDENNRQNVLNFLTLKEIIEKCKNYIYSISV